MSKSKMVLGKGLGALIPSVTDATERPVTVRPAPELRDDGTSTGVIAQIEIDRIRPNPYQPREEFDAGSLAELAGSIRQKGVIQPIAVRRHGTGSYQLISGERRVRACREAGIRLIPAFIIDVSTKEEMLELALIENIQRERLNPLEIAHSYRRLIDECGYSQDTVALKVGKDRTTVANFMRLLKLPEEIQRSIVANDISMGHARALINLPDRKSQIHLWQRIIRDRLSVRKVEQIVQLLQDASRKGGRGKAKSQRTPLPAQVVEAISELNIRFGTKVRVRFSPKGRGLVELEFYSPADFDRILDLLLSR